MRKISCLLIWMSLLIKNIESVDAVLNFTTGVSFTTGIKDTARFVSGSNIIVYILFENNTICAYS
jgi:hypothetical protein